MKRTEGRQMTSHGSKPEGAKPNYTLRRIKTLLAIIACTILVSIVYILTGLWG